MDKVNAILAKGSWDEADIKVLIQNQAALPLEAKVKLGLAPAPIEAVKEPVRVEEVSTSKKRGRKSTK
jgi:hypothetical protein